MTVRTLLALSLLAAAPAFAEEPDSIYKALGQARDRHAPVLVDFVAPWCYSCYYMAKNVLTGPEWERAGRETVVAQLDADSPEGARWMASWSVKALPTYVLLNADGQEIGRILGEQTRGDFYQWLFALTARGNSLEVLKAAALDGSDASVAAAREVLHAYHARYDSNGGLTWYSSLPKPLKGALARDAQGSTWIARLELQRALAENDVPGCLNVAPMVLSLNLGCERPYELDKVMSCSAGQPEADRRDLLRPQVELMQLLVDKRVLADAMRCADERSVVVGTADLYKALGDGVSEVVVLDRAIADVKKRLGDNLKGDRNLADNLRVYLDRAGRIDELDALHLKLMEAYPDDYVYSFRYAKSLAARGKHAEALPYFEKAATKAYGVNQLRNAELRAKSLQALNRTAEARTVVAEALQTTGPFFPEDAAKLKALFP